MNVTSLIKRIKIFMRKNWFEYLYCLMWGLVIESVYLMLEIKNVLSKSLEHCLEHWMPIVENISKKVDSPYNNQAKIIILLLFVALVIFILASIAERISPYRMIDSILFILIIPSGLFQLLNVWGVILSLFIFTRIVYLFRKKQHIGT